ncbi:uncharacterized protein LOC128261961 [Drosophila gunungcola]|uniref:uncharacterized protein LOC128261961 n=1 Tax=Drosophila gunungcola TaxID=103775 RepID=UPI0022E647A8|nr:uncharacterized protein LOC128261961 [Drosophila gunungcola]
MGLQLLCLLMQLLGFALFPAQCKIILGEEPFEDDFVDVDFTGCAKCEQNYRNFVFVLKSSKGTEEAAASAYPYVACLMWLILAALVIGQRWRQVHVLDNGQRTTDTGLQTTDYGIWIGDYGKGPVHPLAVAVAVAGTAAPAAVSCARI